MSTITLRTDLLLNLLWGNHHFSISPLWRLKLGQDSCKFACRLPLTIGKEIEAQYADTKGIIYVQHDIENQVSIIWLFADWIDSRQRRMNLAAVEAIEAALRSSTYLREDRYALIAKDIVTRIGMGTVGFFMDQFKILYDMRGECGVQDLIKEYERRTGLKLYIQPSDEETKSINESQKHPAISNQVAEPASEEEDGGTTD